VRAGRLSVARNASPRLQALEERAPDREEEYALASAAADPMLAGRDPLRTLVRFEVANPWFGSWERAFENVFGITPERSYRRLGQRFGCVTSRGGLRGPARA